MKEHKTKFAFPREQSAKEVFTYLLSYHDENGYMPTLWEIAAYFSKIREVHYSNQWAALMLKELVKQEKIRVIPKRFRGIEIMTDSI